MLGKTHLAAGTAIALACIAPKSLPELVLGAGVASIGSLICDMDAESSLSRKKSDGILKYTIGLLFFLGLSRFVFKIRIIPYIAQPSTLARILIGLTLFTIVCLHGKDKDHRTFMHSLPVLLILTFCTNLIVPKLTAYFAVGFVSHLLLDLLNFQGLYLFWPLQMKYSLKLCKSSGIVNTVLLAAGSIGLIGIMTLRAIKILG